MVLSADEIRRLAAEGRGGAARAKAIAHQDRIKFHVQVQAQREGGWSQPAADFMAFAANLLPKEKMQMFKALLRYPVATNEVAAVCFDKLARIFDGRNPVFGYQFADSELAADWEAYRKDALGEPWVWSGKGWEYFKVEINSVLVVDLPREQAQGDPLPRPYFYWLPISEVVAFEADPDSGNMEWLAFRQGGSIAAIDGWNYRLFEDKGGMPGALVEEVPHGLGYCPARFFWDEPLSIDTPDVKASPLSKELAALDWLLFYHISKQHLDLYGSYPIYSGYEQNCDFADPSTGEHCDGGILRGREGGVVYDAAGVAVPCPKCGGRRIIGAGSFVEIPVPDKDGQADLRNPVQMLAVDRESLDYNVSEEERLRTAIITAVVGTNEEASTKEAMNEMQVRAGFESQTTVLNLIKRGFEAAQKFIDETVCRLRYGERFTSATIDYGTDFYIYDAAELRERYAKAKQGGSSEAELDALAGRIIETEYRNNAVQLRRMKLLAEIEPFRHLTRSEALNLYDKGLISQPDLLLKLDLAGLVSRFERENTNILDFGALLPMDRKIDIIKQTLYGYVSENERRQDTGLAAGTVDERQLHLPGGGGTGISLPRRGEEV